MAADAAVNVALNIMVNVVGAEQAAQSFRYIAREGQNASFAMGGVGRATGAMGGQAHVAAGNVQNLGKSMGVAGQVAFRYSYYAMMALRLGQMLLARKALSAPIEQAKVAAEWVMRLRALSQEIRDIYGELHSGAMVIALETPYAFEDAIQAMENLYRVGRPVADLTREAYAITRMAVVSGRDLAIEAGFIGTVLNVFEGSLEGVEQASDAMVAAMLQSRFTISDLDAALSNAMATAAAFNQTFENTLTLITAFGRAGVEASRAGTMVRRLIVRVGDPDVRNFYEGMLAGYTEVMGRLGRDLPRDFVAPTLFDPETGDFGDMGRSIAGVAEMMSGWIYEAEGVERAERWRAATEALYELFGIRQIEPFLALADIKVWDAHNETLWEGVEAYDYLNRAINDSHGTLNQYMAEVRKNYWMTEQQLDASAKRMHMLVGGPMLEILRPLRQIQTEMINVTANLLVAYPALRKILAGFTLLGAATFAVAGGLGVMAGIGALLMNRLADIGQSVLGTLAAGGDATMIARAARAGVVPGMAPRIAGQKYMLSFIAGPMRVLATTMKGVLFGLTAWHLNLGGIQELLGPIFARWGEVLDQTGRLAARIVSPEAGEPGVFGKAFRAGMKAVPDVFVSAMLDVFRVGAEIFASVFQGMFFAFENVVMPLLTGISWVVGLGDPERGMTRMAQLLGGILGAVLTLKGVVATWKLAWMVAKGARWLAGGLGRLAPGLLPQAMAAPAGALTRAHMLGRTAYGAGIGATLFGGGARGLTELFRQPLRKELRHAVTYGYQRLLHGLSAFLKGILFFVAKGAGAVALGYGAIKAFQWLWSAEGIPLIARILGGILSTLVLVKAGIWAVQAGITLVKALQKAWFFAWKVGVGIKWLGGKMAAIPAMGKALTTISAFGTLFFAPMLLALKKILLPLLGIAVAIWAIYEWFKNLFGLVGGEKTDEGRSRTVFGPTHEDLAALEKGIMEEQMWRIYRDLDFSEPSSTEELTDEAKQVQEFRRAGLPPPSDIGRWYQEEHAPIIINYNFDNDFNFDNDVTFTGKDDPEFIEWFESLSLRTTRKLMEEMSHQELYEHYLEVK